MPIPKSRKELTDLVSSSGAKLIRELQEAGPDVDNLRCVDDWTIKDLLAVRAWWTESVLDWIEAGRRGEKPVTPAPGYTWQETPRLNADIIKTARRDSYDQTRARLKTGIERVLATIETLDDTELLEPGVFEWAGKWPIARWVSINTARQYTTARTYVRRALREALR